MCSLSSVFAFFSRNKKLVKLLQWEDGGFVIWMKRLEQGGFHIPQSADGRIELSFRYIFIMVVPEVTTLAEARDAIRDLAEEVEKLSNELAWFKRQMFGSKTEHYIPEDNTPSLFPEEESPEPSKEVPTATVAEHERKVRQANALSEIPGDLPREERVIDVPEEERLGMVLIGYEESERRTGRNDSDRL